MNESSSIPAWGRRVLTVVSALLLAIATEATAADSMDREAVMDGYTVRWSAAVTGFLPQPMVEKHHLGSGGRGVLNVVVLEQMEDGKPAGTVRADVSVTAYNLAGQLLTIDMQPVTANDRISYHGTFDVQYGDELDFTIRVRPPGRKQPFTVDFERRFLPPESP